METCEESITEACSKSKRNCSLHFRCRRALSSCLRRCVQVGRELRTRITPLSCRQRLSPGKAELAVSPSLSASTAPGLHTTAGLIHPGCPRKLLSPT